MSIEADPEIQGVLIKNQTVILEPNRQQELERKGYGEMEKDKLFLKPCLLYTSPSPRDGLLSRMPSSA